MLDKDKKTFTLQYSTDPAAREALYTYAIYTEDVDLRIAILRELQVTGYTVPERVEKGYDLRG